MERKLALMGYLTGEAVEEAAGEVEHVHGPIDFRIHVLDADKAADGDDGPVAAEAVTCKEIRVNPNSSPREGSLNLLSHVALASAWRLNVSNQLPK